MPTLTLPDGATIWYRRSGEGSGGSPLLHLHGSAFGHRNFERLTPLMEPHVEVIDLDLPGYGESHGGPTGQDFDGMAAQVAAFVRGLGLDRVHVHGTSFGAMVGLTLAARHPELVDRLVLSCFLARYDSAARMMRATWKRAAVESGMDAVADLTAVAGFARAYYDRDECPGQLASMREAFARTRPEAFVTSTEVIERADLSPLVDLVGAPLLLLAGEEDDMTPFEPSPSGVGMSEIAERLRTRGTGVQTAVLPTCGHYLVIESAPEAAALIAEFLS